MQTTALQGRVKAEDIPIERLAGSKSVPEEQKVGELSRQFEAVLLRQILQEAQKPIIKTKSADSGAISSIYKDMIVNQTADNISKSSSIGLAKSLKAQLSHQLLKKDEAGKAAASTKAT